MPPPSTVSSFAPGGEVEHTDSTEFGPADLLLARFRTVRAETLRFTDLLSPEDLMVQSSPDASPAKWHLAHTSWFFETFVLADFFAGYQPFHADYRWLFNSYYNALGEMPEKKLRASFSRPALADILGYREHVDRHVERLLLSAEPDNEVLHRITLGLEHEAQHLELIATDIKHALFTNPLRPAYLEGSLPELTSSTPLKFSTLAGGLVEVGASSDSTDPLQFAFDNETPRHKVFLLPFQLANRLVTCAEYLLFLNDNGYSRPELWLSEGWTAARDAGWQAPLYWMRDSGCSSGWSVYTLAGTVPLDDLLSTPVCHLSLFEADAFARWAGAANSPLHTPGARLPTEFEWEYARQQFRQSTPMPSVGSLHPAAAPAGPGPQQMAGEVWEWTASPYTGYPGYRALPGALGEYNGKFMSSQVVLRGGSCVTPRHSLRSTYRNFFPPGTRWQFSGLRLALDVA